jgi:hypothetical protein
VIWAAFLISPLATPVAIWALFTGLYVLGIGWFAGREYAVVLNNVLLFGFFATPVAYVVTLLGALPLYRFARRKGWLRLRHCVLFGACLGALPFLLFDAYIAVYELSRALARDWLDPFFGPGATLSRLLKGLPAASAWIGLGTICGVATGASFWAIGMQGIASRNSP